MKYILNTFLFTLLVFQSLFGQNITETTKDTTELSGEIEEVTVTAFRTPYNVFNTPAPVNLITSLQLEKGNSFTPVEALNQVPGVLMHHGTTNTNRLTIRGIGSRTPYSTNKIKAYFGEIPLTSGDGETTLEDLENPAIKRVEIIKGPSSSLYGAGLAGVILFHPKNVTRNFAQNKTTIASFNTIKNTTSAGITEKKMNIFALGSMLNSTGFRESNENKRFNFLLNSTYSISQQDNIQVLLKSTKMKAFIPSSLDYNTYLNSPENAASNWKNANGYEEYLNGQFGVSFNYLTNYDGKISVATFGSIKNLDEHRPFNILEENSNYLGWRAYLQKIISGENTRLVFTSGLEFFREKFAWKTLSNQNQNLLSDNLENRQYENLFFQMESNFNEIVFVSAGLNGNLTRFQYTDHYLENGDQSGEHAYKPVLSPRLGINLNLSEKIAFFSNLSHGFSTPSFEETLFPEGELNPEIKPESGWNSEIGFRSQFTEKLLFSASYYRIYVKNLLVARRTGEDAYIGVNAGKSIHPGLETEIRWRINEAGQLPSLTLIGNATFANYHFQDFVDEGIDFSGNLLPGTAKNTWLASAEIGISKNFSSNIWYRSTGKMPANDANSVFSDGFGISHAELKYKGKHKHIIWELKSGIQNIFDVKYASMLAVNAPSFGGNAPRYYYPGNPRNYFVSVLIGIE